jgi:hypothetical protein
MAKKKDPESPQPDLSGSANEAAELDWGEPVWDTETKEELQEPIARFRDNVAYLNAPLFKMMETQWGRGFPAIRTITNEKTREIFVYKSTTKELGHVPVRRLGAQNTAEINLFRPMTKLEIKVPSDRVFVVTPFKAPLAGVGVGFIFPMAQYKSEPRKDTAADGGATDGTAQDGKAESGQNQTPPAEQSAISEETE